MIYYEIYRMSGEQNVGYMYPEFIVESEDIAKDICKKYRCYFYETRDTEEKYYEE